MSENLRRNIVEVGFEHRDGVGFPIVCGGLCAWSASGRLEVTKDGAQNIGTGDIVSRAEAIADLPRHKSGEWAETLRKLCQQGGARRCDKLLRFVALRYGHASCGENFERGGSRQRHPPMRAGD